MSFSPRRLIADHADRLESLFRHIVFILTRREEDISKDTNRGVTTAPVIQLLKALCEYEITIKYVSQVA
jgi:hypothetical protein